MGKKTRQLLLIATVAVSNAMFFAAGAIVQPVWVQKAWICLMAPTRWDKLNSLGRLVEPGMTPAEVQAILGRPSREDESARTVTWMYREEGRGAGDELYVRFEISGTAGHEDLRVLEVLQDHEAVRGGHVDRDYGRKYYRISVAQLPPR